MERQTSSSPVEQTDAVAETLERLEVADTLEQLRHHIDDLIERLSSEQQGSGAVARSTNGVAPELESQIEHLGEKVESASDLLTELTDLLEAQTERIETIEQQLGDSDLSGYGGGAVPDRNRSDARGAIPTFAMRPPHREPAAIAAPDPSDILREYVDARLERLEDCIRALEIRMAQMSEAAVERDLRIAEMSEEAIGRDLRIAEMSEAALERDRQVRELEDRLLILVDAGVNPGAPDAEPPRPRDHGAAHGAANAYAPRSFAAGAARPAAMPLFAHRSAPIERPVVRAHARPSHTSREARQIRVEHGERSSREDEEGGAVERLVIPAVVVASESGVTAREHGGEEHEATPPDAGPDACETGERHDESESPPRNGVAARLLGRESPGVRMHAAVSGAAVPHDEVEERAESPDDARCADDHRAEEVVSRPLRKLEEIVERDVRLRRDFGPRDARPAKARPNVMVVDDSPDALTVLSIFLSKTGYQVVTATSAEDCLAKLRHHHIDAVVLDARMPGADGGHVCRVLRDDPAYASRRDVPVIVYTAYPDDFPASVRDAWRADDYVVKGGDMLPLITSLVRHTTAPDA